MTTLSTCPFCDEQPSFTDVELKDERRYAEKQLRCCSITMSAALSFGKYKGLTDAQIDHTLRSELVKNWNQRVPLSDSVAQAEPKPLTADERWCAANGISYDDPTMQRAELRTHTPSTASNADAKAKLPRIVTTTFDEVDCKQLRECGWPECECPKRPKAGFACPLCGLDTPHHHSTERTIYPECDGCMNPACEDCFDQEAIADTADTTQSVLSTEREGK